MPIGVAAVLGVGALLGLALTWTALERRYDPGALSVGSWTTWPRAGTTELDPYAGAIMARGGEIALSAVEGIAFTAVQDDGGANLDGRCHYSLRGGTPPARAWTLALYRPDGSVVDNAAGRFALTSGEVLRREDGSVTIEVGPTPLPGNWLPAPASGPFNLVLRAYEPSFGTGSAKLEGVALPAITRRDCRR